MQKIHKYYVKDKNGTYGILVYDEITQEFHMHIDKTADLSKAPILITAFADKGMYDLTPEWSMRWVQARIIPPNRANIIGILQAAGLREYSEWGMLLYCKGRCAQDNMWIEEIVDS